MSKNALELLEAIKTAFPEKVYRWLKKKLASAKTRANIGFLDSLLRGYYIYFGCPWVMKVSLSFADEGLVLLDVNVKCQRGTEIQSIQVSFDLEYSYVNVEKVIAPLNDIVLEATGVFVNDLKTLLELKHAEATNNS